MNDLLLMSMTYWRSEGVKEPPNFKVRPASQAVQAVQAVQAA